MQLFGEPPFYGVLDVYFCPYPRTFWTKLVQYISFLYTSVVACPCLGITYDTPSTTISKTRTHVLILESFMETNL